MCRARTCCIHRATRSSPRRCSPRRSCTRSRRGVALAHYDEFGDVADHCTVCHKCEPACPVDIDFGDVSIAMRNLLRRAGKRRANPGTQAAMLFLNLTDPRTIKLARTLMIEWGYKLQRFAFSLMRPLVK